MNLNDFSPFAMVEEINSMIEEYIEANFHRVNAYVCDLDPRAAFELFVNDDAIVCRKSRVGSLDYYGGFEYIEKEYRAELGDYVFFFNYGGEERIADAINSALDAIAEKA